jgi:hypothetical protein
MPVFVGRPGARALLTRKPAPPPPQGGGPIAFRAAGTMGASGVGNGTTTPKLSATPGAPAGLTQNDLMILVIQGWDAAGLAGLGAYTLVKSNAGLAQPNGSEFGGFISVYKKIAGAAETMPTVQINDARGGNFLLAQMLAFNGGLGLTEGEVSKGVWSPGATGITGIGVTTTGADRIVVNCWQFGGTDEVTNITAGNADTGWTERVEGGGASNRFDKIVVDTIAKATAGAQAAPARTLSSNSAQEYGIIGFAVA